jgi:hypothetical protein
MYRYCEECFKLQCTENLELQNALGGNIFLWQALHDKIQSAAEEKGKNNWQWGEFCALCGKLESVNHICFIASRHSRSLA